MRALLVAMVVLAQVAWASWAAPAPFPRRSAALWAPGHPAWLAGRWRMQWWGDTWLVEMGRDGRFIQYLPDRARARVGTWRVARDGRLVLTERQVWPTDSGEHRWAVRLDRHLRGRVCSPTYEGTPVRLRRGWP